MALSPICQVCVRPNPHGARFCAWCGQALVQGTDSASVQDLVERKHVSVVFIDIVGSLSMIRDQDPEDAHEVLTSALSLMSQAVHAYGGVVAEVQGDGIMAIFGAPQAQEDHATRACYAALRLHSLVEQRGDARIALRVGINSGEVAVGPVVNDFSSDFTAAGAVVHIAARLQGLAPPNATVMTGQTAAQVRAAMHTEPLGPTTLKGLAAPIEVHRLVGPIAAQERSSRQIRPTFVGRSDALAVLAGMLEAAQRGQGNVVGVIGEAGIGKTTLIERFLQQHRGSPLTLARTAALYHTSVAPLNPFVDVVLQLLGLQSLRPAQRQPALVARLRELGLDRHTCEPPLLDLLGLDGAPEAWRELAALSRRDQVGAAVIQVLLAASRGGALVVVLEDLQQADSATVDLIDRAIRAIVRHPVLLIVAFRPELEQAWTAHDNYRELHLDRLSADESRALVFGLLGKTVAMPVERQLVTWSKGNPLFLRETLLALIEAGAVDDPAAAERVTVPPSIGGVVAARIDRLAAEAKRVLLTASVLGTEFAFDVLADASRLDELTLRSHLDVLVAADFIRRHDGADSSYGFQHGLIQEVSYATLLRRQRRDLHRAAYFALRRRDKRSLQPSAEELAHHAYGGELWADAIALCGEAGRRAAARYSNREAEQHFEHAANALAREDLAGQRLEEAIALRLELRAVSIPLLRLDRIGALLAEASDMAERLGDVSLRARIAGFLGGHAYLTRSPMRCIELCRGAVRLARRAADSTLTIAPVMYMAQSFYGLGQYRRAIATLGPALPLEEAAMPGTRVGLPLRPLLMHGYWLAISQAELGDFAAAEALVGRMLAVSDARQPFEALYSLTAQGFVRLLRGDLQAALQASRVALDVAESNEIAFIIPVLASQVGYLMASQGQAKAGMAMALRGTRKAEELGIYAGRSRWSARAAEACILAGDLVGARQHAQNALSLAESGQELGYLCSALRLRAKTRVIDGDLAGAAADLQRATEQARKLRIGPALAKCLFDGGALAHHLGHVDKARRSLLSARRMFHRYGMASGAERTADVLAQLRPGMTGPAAEVFFGSAE